MVDTEGFTPAPPSGSRARVGRVIGRLARAVAWALGVAILVAVVAVGALWAWAGTEGSLARALALAARSQPLQVQDATGALRGGGRIGRLAWEQDGLSVEARDVGVAWQPLRLLFGELALGPLTAASVDILDRRPSSGEPLAAPTSLGLPLRVAVDGVRVARLHYDGATTFDATGLLAFYDFDGLFHRLRVASIDVARGHYRGDLRLGAYGEMPLRLRLSGDIDGVAAGGSTPVPLNFEASAQGPIAALALEGRLQAAVRNAQGAADAAEATLQAQVAPFAPQPLTQARTSFRRLDLAALWPGAPQTRLSGDAQLQPDTARPQAWAVAATIDNDAPGPIDRQRLPLERLEAEAEWHAGVALVRRLEARSAGGTLSASGRWTDAATLRWQLAAQARGIDPGQLHSGFAAQPLGGQATLQGEGAAFSFDARLAAAGTPGRAAAAPATRRGAAASAIDLRALRLREASARGRWGNGQLALDAAALRTDDARLDARDVRVAFPVRGASGQLSFAAPGIALSAAGELRETSGAGRLDAAADDAQRALAWLAQWPVLQDALAGLDLRGRATLAARWQGGWRDPALDAKLGAPSLDVRTAATGTDALQLRDVDLQLAGRIADARLSLRGRVRQAERQLSVQTALQGGMPGFSSARWPDWSRAAWQARLNELSLSLEDPALAAGSWRLATRGPVALRWAPQAAASSAAWFEAGAGEAVLTAPTLARTGAAAAAAAAPPAAPRSATVAWQPGRWRPGEWATAGRVTGLPLAWVEVFAGPQLEGLGLTGTLVFDGSWDATLAQTLRVSATLARASGDLTVRAEDGAGGATRVAAGVREARLTLDNQGEQLRLALRWDSERAGTADARLSTRLVRSAEGGWQWPADAPLDGRVNARLPRIGVWSVLAPPGWRLRGALAADLAVRGTRAAPQLDGTLSADDLALRSVVDGIEFGNGRLRARLAGTRMVIDEFVLEGAGERGAGGTVSAKGEAGWIDGRAQARLDAQVRQLRASIRTDRQLTVSGDIGATLDGASAALKGALTVDRALIVLPDEGKPVLGDDVIVLRGGSAAAGAKAPADTARADAATTDKRTLALAVKLDLGRDFRVQGKGIDTRVAGTLDITGATLAAPRINGAVRTVGGQYRAYGQRLDVAQGTLIFSGPPDNPALDILALRANMLSDQKVGVQITGTALLPRVRLYALPDLPDAEKLSWLVLGRSSASGGAEAALLQQAALALLGSKSGGMSGGLANALGLDELSVRGSSTSESGTTTEGAITLGKRFSRNFYAAYERSLSGALGTLYVFYDLSRRWTVRAQTGEQSAVDLIYTLSYD